MPSVRALIGMFLAAAPAVSASDRWDELPPLPTPRQEVGVAASDGAIWVIGGITAARLPSALVERYDVAAGRWEPAPSLPDASSLHHVGAASLGGIVYALGGLDAGFRAVRSVYALEDGADAWVRRADLPWPRGAMAAGVLAGRIIVAGGQDGGTSFADAAWFDAERNEWDELPPLRVARNHLAGATLDAEFYAIAGRRSTLFGVVEVFDPAALSWREVAPIPTPRAGIAAVAVAGRILVFGGEGNPRSPVGIFAEVESYDPSSDRWSQRPPMARPRHGIGAALVDGRVHIPGGGPVQGFGVTGVHDALAPSLADSGHCAEFLRGDANRDGAVDISDAVRILVHLFVISGIECDDAADADDSGELELTDAVVLLDFLFRGGASLPPPGSRESGPDPSPDRLGCAPNGLQ